MWGKREDMIVRDQSPFNAEPPAAVLAEGGITALDAFYARNHGAFPDIPVEEWRLTVAGMFSKPGRSGQTFGPSIGLPAR